jgi:hypothetical protein
MMPIHLQYPVGLKENFSISFQIPLNGVPEACESKLGSYFFSTNTTIFQRNETGKLVSKNSNLIPATGEEFVRFFTGVQPYEEYLIVYGGKTICVLERNNEEYMLIKSFSHYKGFYQVFVEKNRLHVLERYNGEFFIQSYDFNGNRIDIEKKVEGLAFTYCHGSLFILDQHGYVFKDANFSFALEKFVYFEPYEISFVISDNVLYLLTFKTSKSLDCESCINAYSLKGELLFTHNVTTGTYPCTGLKVESKNSSRIYVALNYQFLFFDRKEMI